MQECLNNVVRHARARTVRIELAAGAWGWEIGVRDDGCGFTPLAGVTGAAGMGLAGMRERLRRVEGCLDVRTRPGEGCEVRLWVPRRKGDDARHAAAGR